MRILVAGDFDPCGVHLRHRRFLRELGVDYRLAVKHAYRKEAHEADYLLERKSDYADMRWFAQTADIIQLLPAIEQPWTFQDEAPRYEDLFFGATDFLNDSLFKSATKTVCFHGSRNAWANRKAYTDHWRARGVPILATTIDYAYEMQAHYLPSIVDVTQPPRLRQDDEPLRVLHSPTDPSMCDTQRFLELCTQLHIDVTYLTGRPHEAILEHKRYHSVGFDHMRGCFGVNSLENVAHGMVNLVRIDERYQDVFDNVLPWPTIRDWNDLETVLGDLNPARTREWQLDAHGWFNTYWTPQQCAARILKVYEAIRA